LGFLDNTTNKQLLQKLKSRKFNDSVVFAYLECICYLQKLEKRTRSQICVVPFCNFGNWITFGLLQIRCLFFICSFPPTPSLLLLFHYT